VLGGTAPSSSGVGITFPATQSASSDANTLDDYEEGTFTPTLTFGGASTGITGNFSGKYTKIGNVVYYAVSIGLTSKGSATGDAGIGGLPFTSASGFFPNGTPRSVADLTFTAPLYAGVNQSATTMFLLDNNGGAQAAITNADFTNSTELNVVGFYYV